MSLWCVCGGCKGTHHDVVRRSLDPLVREERLDHSIDVCTGFDVRGVPLELAFPIRDEVRGEDGRASCENRRNSGQALRNSCTTALAMEKLENCTNIAPQRAECCTVGIGHQSSYAPLIRKSFPHPHQCRVRRGCPGKP